MSSEYKKQTRWRPPTRINQHDTSPDADDQPPASLNLERKKERKKVISTFGRDWVGTPRLCKRSNESN